MSRVCRSISIDLSRQLNAAAVAAATAAATGVTENKCFNCGAGSYAVATGVTVCLSCAAGKSFQHCRRYLSLELHALHSRNVLRRAVYQVHRV